MRNGKVVILIMITVVILAYILYTDYRSDNMLVDEEITQSITINGKKSK